MSHNPNIILLLPKYREKKNTFKNYGTVINVCYARVVVVDVVSTHMNSAKQNITPNVH